MASGGDVDGVEVSGGGVEAGGQFVERNGGAVAGVDGGAVGGEQVVNLVRGGAEVAVGDLEG
ncbi:MAG: hypothetical protein M3021_06825 [Actinomycetota bacterium]|nr:hypothetical protein [Actinomycetota bacterium]